MNKKRNLQKPNMTKLAKIYNKDKKSKLTQS